MIARGRAQVRPGRPHPSIVSKECSAMPVQRYATVIRLRPEHEAEYRALHAEVWPGVLEALRRAHVTNYSIFLRDGYMFSYMEYVGDDFETDMAGVGDDEASQRWWKVVDPCVERLPTARPDEGWVPAEEIFHMD
jgi:L-rhamnose mutarotase